MGNRVEVIYFACELEMLEAHIDTHRPFFDRIIVAESPKTVSGLKKPLFFPENKSRYEKYDVEYHVIPEDHITERGKEYSVWRVQDHFKKSYMHSKLCEELPESAWVLHSDTDEILDPSRLPVILDMLKNNSEWLYAANPLWQFNSYINLRHSINRHVYRWYRAHSSLDMVSPKGSPRILLPENLGWHFNSIFSCPDELYWKCKNREWTFENSPTPTMEECSKILNALNFPLEDFPFKKSIYDHLMQPDRVISDPTKIRDINTLPKWFGDNINRFPYIDSDGKPKYKSTKGI